MTFNLALQLLPHSYSSPLDSNIVDFPAQGKLQYRMNVTMLDSAQASVISLKQIDDDFSGKGLVPKSRKFEFRCLNAPVWSNIKTAIVLDQMENLVLDSIYLMKISNDNAFAKIAFDTTSNIAGYDPLVQKLTYNYINFDNGTAAKEALVIMKKQAPAAKTVPDLSVNENGGLTLPMSQLFHDPDSIHNDMTFQIPNANPTGISISISNGNVVVHTNPCFSGNTSFSIQATHDGLTVSNAVNIMVIDDVDNVVQAAVKVFLQGPYVSNVQLMHDSLRTKNLIPLTEPYTGLTNFVHIGGGGEQTTPAVLAITGPDAIVDWVFLELRSATNPAQVLATRSALLQRDGDVVDVDGASPVVFSITADEYYFLAVRHRNHLGAQLGAASFYPKCAVVETDFRSVPPEGFYAFNGLNAAEKTLDGKYAMWAGNGRVDYQLKYNGSNNDRTAILSVVGLSTPNAVVPGYLLADYNLDGQVKYNGSANDRNVLLGNVGITTPSAILHDQIGR